MTSVIMNGAEGTDKCKELEREGAEAYERYNHYYDREHLTALLREILIDSGPTDVQIYRKEYQVKY